MFFGSFISGLIPLKLTLSESKMRFITLIGAGLLVGTALAVIIPEGVHSLYSNDLQHTHSENTGGHNHGKRNANYHQESLQVKSLNNQQNSLLAVNKRDSNNNNNNMKLENTNKDVLLDQNNLNNNHQIIDIDHDHDDKNNEKINNKNENVHSSIGVTLVLGFVFMLIVDQIGGNISHIQSNDAQNARNKITFTTTLGLVIHAGVDGLALGAAASSTQTDIKMIVFIAIMLHKAPASFGLVSFLLHEGLDRARAKRHLTLFALAAPIMAIVTYLALNMPNYQTMVSSSSTGLCMLFSAGTFLYVSTVHVLPEVQSHNDTKQFRLSELICLVFGAIFPLFISVGHSH